MANDLPFKASMKYPELLSIRVDKETKEIFQLLKGHGVDVGQISRSSIKDCLLSAIKKIETKQKKIS